jgi:hypothetical protein
MSNLPKQVQTSHRPYQNLSPNEEDGSMGESISSRRAENRDVEESIG